MSVEKKPKIECLTRELATEFADVLVNLANLIPNVSYSADEILAESKAERCYLGKWNHSLVCLYDGQPVGLLIAYERTAEPGTDYKINSIYLNIMAVNTAYQNKGIGSALLDFLVAQVSAKPFLFLPGKPTIISTQTNSASFNTQVLNWYIKRGFKVVGTKSYDNRNDYILQRTL